MQNCKLFYSTENNPIYFSSWCNQYQLDIQFDESFLIGFCLLMSFNQLVSLTYISRHKYKLSSTDIVTIGKTSNEKNKKLHITGCLLALNGFFFQTIEGEKNVVQQLFSKISNDPRHYDIYILKNENIQKREYPDWSMNTVNLDEKTDILLTPIKRLLATVAESHRVLEKYTQPSVFKLIQQGTNPLSVAPKKVERIVMFCDVVKFTNFSEMLEAEQLIHLLQRFFSICTNIVQKYGGEASKFVGDAMMAYFDGKQVIDAMDAALEILSCLQSERTDKKLDENNPLRYLYSGIGLAKGVVIEGNISTSIKIDYTVIGDTVNLASRLETQSRKYPYHLIFEEKMKMALIKYGKYKVIGLGKVGLKGKSNDVALYTVDAQVNKKPKDFENVFDEYFSKTRKI